MRQLHFGTKSEHQPQELELKENLTLPSLEIVFSLWISQVSLFGKSGLAAMSRLARSRLQQSDYGFQDRTLDWDHAEM